MSVSVRSADQNCRRPIRKFRRSRYKPNDLYPASEVWLTGSILLPPMQPHRPVSGIIFVYNADSGALSTVLDIGHKILSPDTYQCQLCSLTHSTFSMRKEWRDFVARIGIPVEFLHRDELARRYGLTEIPLPTILLKTSGGPEPWIDRVTITDCRTLDDLERLIEARLKTIQPSGPATN
jgi:hypothetical protein